MEMLLAQKILDLEVSELIKILLEIRMKDPDFFDTLKDLVDDL